AFRWNCQCLLNDMQVRDVAPSGEPQERTYGRQANIAAAHCVVPVPFKMFKETGQELRVDVSQLQCRRRLAQVLLGKAQHEQEGITIGRNGTGAKRSLLQ